MKYRLYDIILEEYQCENENFTPEEFVGGFCFDECGYEDVDVSELPKYRQYRSTFDGIDIYYDFVVCYYFFVEKVEVYNLFTEKCLKSPKNGQYGQVRAAHTAPQSEIS